MARFSHVGESGHVSAMSFSEQLAGGRPSPECALFKAGISGQVALFTAGEAPCLHVVPPAAFPGAGESPVYMCV